MSTPLEHAKQQVSLQRKTSRARREVPRDAIDRLDESVVGAAYHHEGPFDATLKSRQIAGRAPMEATKLGNAIGPSLARRVTEEPAETQIEQTAHGTVEYYPGDEAEMTVLPKNKTGKQVQIEETAASSASGSDSKNPLTGLKKRLSTKRP